MKNSKSAILATFAASYDRWEFKAQMMAMSNIAKALGLKMWISASDNTATKYEFKTANGRQLFVVTLKNIK